MTSLLSIQGVVGIMEFSNKVYKKHSMCGACIIRSSNIVDNLRAGQNIQEAFTVVGTASLSVVGTIKPSSIVYKVYKKRSMCSAHH